MQRCYGRHFIHVTFPENLQTTSGLSILLDGVLSLPNATSCNNLNLTYNFCLFIAFSHIDMEAVYHKFELPTSQLRTVKLIGTL